MVVAAAGVLAIGVLVTVVLPRFAAILSDIGQTLPASTRLVLAGAKLVEGVFVPALAIAVACAIAGRAWTSTERGRRALHAMLLRLPVIGGLRRGLATSRAAHSLAALLENGVAISTALPFAARASGDAVLEQRFTACRSRVATGESLSRALDATNAATPTTVRLIRAGEESGRVPSMLEHAARIERDRANRVIRTGVKLLEPILLLVFASAVALIAAALLQAVYSVRPT
jgi:type II secretory pathway component PulF